ncbi:60S ribosomal export protein NMD3 [Anabrus simplex]|uniref:60S ribosomal export protein NMD3 n=1 Tax=Anabrus simplex TaxID=316456 RepID=UPI0035A2AF11
MEYIDFAANFGEEKNRILCCQCGTSIEPNPANMCVACLRTQVDITEGIPKQATLYFCKGCERYLQPPAEWVPCALESRELLSLCLRKLKGLNRVKLVDAGFVWTEPHSKRIKVKLTVHGEVLGGAVLQQVFVVEFTVSHQMCDDCHRVEAQDYWRALVQVRQKAENKKTFYYLEQLILKHKAHENTLGIKPIHEGLDFFFSTEAHARKMVDFLTSVLPCRYQHSKKLISHDIHSNIYNYKFTYSVEIVPLSKDSVVCLPKRLTQQLGGINPICLVYRVTNSVHLIDASTAQIAELSSTNFWRYPFSSICNPKQLTEYIVMDLELIREHDRKSFPGQGAVSNKHLIADVWVVRAAELGVTENTIHTRTHLGHILKPGDSVLGYALGDSNVNDTNLEKLDTSKIPDVILVKKFYGNRAARRRERNWKLKHLAEDNTNINTGASDYHEFLDDLEEDPVYRQNVNIFRDRNKQIAVDIDDMEDPDEPRITLEEMLDDLCIEDTEMTEVQ